MSFPIQAIPYIRLVRRVLSGPGSLEIIAFQKDVLCPEERTEIRPAVYLPGQIDRIRDYKPTDHKAITTKETEIAEATSTTVSYAPTIAYHIKNAVLVDGSIYVGHFKHPIAEKSLFNSFAHEPRHIETCALASTYLGTRFFGHWLVDDCTKYMLAEEFGVPLCLRMPVSAYGHQQKYQKYFGQDWTPIDRARIDHLIVFQDFSQNSLKRKRYRILSDRIKAHFPGNASNAYIYLKRGRTGAPRIIQNEDEIIDTLIRRGFMVLDISSDSLDHIIATLMNAKIVVSVEGSHLAHFTYTSPENSGLLVLQPADRFIALQRAWSECSGVTYGFVVGDIGDAGYCFSIPEILDTVDLLLNRVENS